MNKRIIIGSKGFLGGAVYKYLSSSYENIIGISREKVDLTIRSSSEALHDLVQDGDDVYFFSAVAPCKNEAQSTQNLEMAQIFCKGIESKILDKFIYISSDAVYKDSLRPITENSPIGATNWHGSMHYLREQYFTENVRAQSKIFLRPTMVYGCNDPHNGYGPNLFVRQSKMKNEVNLFGKGEELRDHLSITDFTNIFYKILKKNFSGHINICSGKAITFLEVAESIKFFNPNLKIIFNKRIGDIPHNGYRIFDISALKKLIGDYKFHTIESYLYKHYKKYN